MSATELTTTPYRPLLQEYSVTHRNRYKLTRIRFLSLMYRPMYRFTTFESLYQTYNFQSGRLGDYAGPALSYACLLHGR